MSSLNPHGERLPEVVYYCSKMLCMRRQEQTRQENLSDKDRHKIMLDTVHF